MPLRAAPALAEGVEGGWERAFGFFIGIEELDEFELLVGGAE